MVVALRAFLDEFGWICVVLDEDPFNKFLYPEKSRDSISNMDASNNSRQPV